MKRNTREENVAPGADSAPAALDHGEPNTEGTPGNGAGDAAETVAPDPRVLLAEAQEKYLRAKAEMENYRKRVQREFGEIRQQVKLTTVQEFLPVFDFLQMAMDHADGSADVASLKQGMEMIATEFRRALEGLGVTPIDAAGAEFDPDLHEAVAQQPSPDVPEGRIMAQWKCGFRIGERLVRPAAVVVSAGAGKEAPAEEGTET